MKLTPDIIEHIASPECINRGREYYERGAVQLQHTGEVRATALVQGKRQYHVTVRQTSDGTVTGTCTCPSAAPICRHIVATLCAIQDLTVSRNLTPEKLAFGNTAHGPGAHHRRTPRWAKSIARVIPGSPGVPPPADPGSSWRLAYSLDIRGGNQRLLPLRIRMRRDGTDGQVSILNRFDSDEVATMDLADRLILTWIQTGTGHPSGPDTARDDRHRSWRWNDVFLLLKDKELYVADRTGLTGRRIAVRQETARFVLTLSEAGGDISLFPEVEWNGTRVPVSSDLIALTADPLWVLHEDTILRLAGLTIKEIEAFQRMASPLSIPSSDRENFFAHTLPHLLSRFSVRSELTGFRTVEGHPRARLYLREVEGGLTAELRFLYNDVEVPGTPPLQTQPETLLSGGTLVAVRRLGDEENLLRDRLAEFQLRPHAGSPESMVFEPVLHPLEWLARSFPRLRTAGFELFGNNELKRYRLNAGTPLLAMRISSGIDWFDLSVDMRFEGTPASLEAFAAAIQRNEHFVRLGDGSYGVLPEAWIRRFRRTFTLATPAGEAFRFSRSHIGLLDDLAAAAGSVTADEAFQAMRERLRSFSGFQHPPLAPSFHGTLRPYQQAGYDWLLFLHDFGFGGILADDMGLGKTVQTLALLQYLAGKGDHGPSLIVVPTSLVFNWQNEAARFTPDLRVLVYRGLDRKKYQDQLEAYHLVITSYGILRRDIEFLKSIKFRYAVLDESQNIKNFASVNARAARHLIARHRLALTGTPVENNLVELWSQFEFLNPGMLGGLRPFIEDFSRPIERSGDADALAALRRLTGPFVLRRTKELVAADLPQKFESTVLCDMDTAQRTAYQHWREYYRRAVVHSIDTLGIQRSKIKVLEGLMRLRQVCCHPSLVDASYRGSSGKFDAFTDMLEDILAGGHKVLVFSQFVRMLAILRRHCDEKGIVYEYLDGRTVHRKERVERFQADGNVKLFLISLKAGGTGLNLTAADYVIHYDPWWNPAVETQATDRTHRIGQTKQVFSYKLITRETVEEKIVALQERKRLLARDSVTSEAGIMKTLTRQDIEQLFG